MYFRNSLLARVGLSILLGLNLGVFVLEGTLYSDDFDDKQSG